MVRLPESGEKRRRQIFKNVYRSYGVWASLIEAEGPEKSVLFVDGEDIHFGDLMVGYDDLPPRQKEAFDLHVLQGMSEGQVTKIMFPGSRWSTPVQQYAKTALIRMIKAYDAVQTPEGRNARRGIVEEKPKPKGQSIRPPEDVESRRIILGLE